MGRAGKCEGKAEELGKEYATGGNDRMQELEEALALEKSDRIESLDTQLKPINEAIDQAFKDLDDERNSRVQKEREILELLTDEAHKVEDAITTEQEGRQER